MGMDVPPPPPPPPPGPYGSSGPGGGSQPVGNPLIGYWTLVVFQRYAQFQGRARRAEYWWFTLANVLIAIVLSALGAASSIFNILYFVYLLAILVPSLAVAVRRLHDTSKSGWWLLIAFIPLIGTIVLIVFLATDSVRGPNQYGPSEKYPVR